MAMGFGKGRHGDAVARPPRRSCATCRRRRASTSPVPSTSPSEETGATAHLYLYDGGLYTVHLDGYVPRVADRLLASGAIDVTRRSWLTSALGSDAGDPRVGPLAVERGWISADALAMIHQEYLLAGLGAVLTCARARVKLRKDASAGDFCTLPLPVDPLIDVLRMRAERLGGNWKALSARGAPATTVVEVRAGADP